MVFLHEWMWTVCMWCKNFICKTYLLLQYWVIYVQKLKSFASRCVDNFFTRLADVHGYNTPNASTHHLYVSFRGTTRGTKTLSYCCARIWNYILDNVDPGGATGTQRLFLNFKDDLLTWFTDTFRYICTKDNYNVSCTYVNPLGCMCTYIPLWGMHLSMHIQSSRILHRWSIYSFTLLCTPKTICLA